MSSEPEIISPGEVEGVYQKYKQDLWKFLLSLCRDSDEASDLFQGVFLKIIEKAKTGYIQRNTLRSFLFTLTYNHFIESRRTRRWEQPGGDSITVAAPDRGVDESERILAVIEGVLAGDDQLPQRSRDVLRLRFLAGMNITDITRVMNISRPTVYSDLAAALGVLRREFEARGLTPELLGGSDS
ncbi:MAG: sigma-70 family RNA polymerase sigma factor [Leptospirales bacterium]